ncbi:hypothetical protein A2757_03290 [Candidatus Giovannonibacteria bacterium RIFCSPHIGHO2_01_FULL_48_47]|nr:MAG: hypothetical protein A2757_03290 [Candidatus Giovannonibacteria bacterium RIFCSPHIGHO2_01_FULL_48_47]OGF88576.1 MAG: hypothetical protein A3B26_02355 [Candidatus Giovannonibacteria bacterium RIFCSPLOWO2_01_FULL_48_47]OGF94990.1 MAG: hypothetical protein A2433_02015 [Candidatus Giovannonibacteria bacterium RIFOXYC1_FULL_48_8]OGF96305.1 MAG: hypothetical protein A2613_01970 [Candidatus Giovannonibacteria bacterium RIFOXYD1_FULL_48_21]HBT81781.1 hypothetical protein [Candidatus Giovannonib
MNEKKELVLEFSDIFWLFTMSVVLTFIAIFFLGGSTSIWFFLLFFGLFYLLNQEQAEGFFRKLGGRGVKLYRAVKTLIFGVLASLVLIEFLGILSGRYPGLAIKGSDQIAFLLYLSIAALFFTWQAGWTKGETGKKWVIRLFVATFIYALLSSLFPAVPRAVTRFVEDGDWIADAYAQRKLKDELAKAWGDGSGKPGPGAPSGELVLPTLPRGVIVFMSPGEEKEYLLQPIGIRLLEGRARVECLACDFPSFYLERERRWGKSNIELVDVEGYYRQHGTRPSVYHPSIFKIKIKAEGVFIFEAL